MRKIPFMLLAIAALVMSCENNSENEVPQESSIAQEIDMSDFYARTDDNTFSKNSSKSCQTMVLLNKELDKNPGLYQKMYDIELHARKGIAHKGKPTKPGGGGGDPDPTPYTGDVNIPVYVHIIYDSTGNNLSQGQIDSQIDVLNEDFTNTNSDLGNVPSGFAGDVGNANIRFTLAGVTRTQNSKSSWPINNSMKYASSGGHDVITPETHLNIWVVNVFDGNGTLGFAYLPGTAPTGADGVVIASPYFGNTGTAGSIFPEFDLGRTTTHEVGHWLNLRHIWGDGRCRQDDLVADTPSSDAPNYGCPSYPTVNCKSTDMTMNYMDYVNDACMYMFSNGQVDRMRVNFATGGERDTMVGN